MVRDVLSLTGVAGALDTLPAKALYLFGGNASKVPVQGIAGFQLLTVDQHRAWHRVRVAVVVEVSEQGKASMLQHR